MRASVCLCVCVCVCVCVGGMEGERSVSLWAPWEEEGIRRDLCEGEKVWTCVHVFQKQMPAVIQ